MFFPFNPDAVVEPLTCEHCLAAYATHGHLCDSCAEDAAHAISDAASAPSTIWTPDEDFHLLPDSDLDSALRGISQIFEPAPESLNLF